MSEAVLISIRPAWAEKILSGEKTVEIRKSRPKLTTPFKCFIYCTKPRFELEDLIGIDVGSEKGKIFFGGGKVVGEFVCDRIDDISRTDEGYDFDVPKMTGLKYEEMAAYLDRKKGYGWHISDVKIYDEPKALSQFWSREDHGAWITWKKVQRGPQSWMYVEEEKHESQRI